MNQSCCKYKWVTSHIYMCVLWREVMCSALTSHVTHMNKSCRKYECVVSCIHMCVLSDFGVKSRAVYEWAISHIWMSHVTHMYAYALVLCREVTCSIWTSHVARINELCHTYICVCSSTLVRGHVQYMNEVCRMCQWVMSYICMHVLRYFGERSRAGGARREPLRCCDVCYAPGTLNVCNYLWKTV